jgi:N utilization substance protein A
MAKKAKQKKAKRGAKKITAKAKSHSLRSVQASGKKGAPKRKAARKPTARRRPVRPTQAVMGSQSVETVPLKRRARTATAGAGGGDFGGVSVVEGADSESANELLEEGQAFEAGIVSGVENAPDADQGEVRTHEEPQDDVPEEYEDKDRP